MSRRRLILVAAFTLLAVGIVAWLMAREEARTVRSGMTHDEVVARLGEPMFLTGKLGWYTCHWQDGTSVSFRDGSVTNVIEPSFLDSARLWLGR